MKIAFVFPAKVVTAEKNLPFETFESRGYKIAEVNKKVWWDTTKHKLKVDDSAKTYLIEKSGVFMLWNWCADQTSFLQEFQRKGTDDAIKRCFVALENPDEYAAGTQQRIAERNARLQREFRESRDY